MVGAGMSETGPESIPSDASESLLQLEPDGFTARCIQITWNVNRLLDDDIAAGEGERYLEAIPTLEADFPLQVIGDEVNGFVGELGEIDKPLLQIVARAARAIRARGRAGPGRG